MGPDLLPSFHINILLNKILKYCTIANEWKISRVKKATNTFPPPNRSILPRSRKSTIEIW